jgi:hypothetical protein
MNKICVENCLFVLGAIIAMYGMVLFASIKGGEHLLSSLVWASGLTMAGILVALVGVGMMKDDNVILQALLKVWHRLDT